MGTKVETVMQACDQLLEMAFLQDVGRTAAEVKGRNPPPAAYRIADKIDLREKRLDIIIDRAGASRHRGMTAAIPTEFLAERDVQIE